MSYGVIAKLDELIDLKRYAQLVQFSPSKQAIRSGNRLSCLRGRGMDFTEVRNYQAGDEIRHMEWRVTARTGKPHIKLYQEERERPVVMLVDFNPSMIFGTKVAFKSVIAARLAAIITWTVIKQGDRIGGFLFSATKHSEFTPRGRDLGALPLLASLSSYTEQSLKEPMQTPRIFSDALLRLGRVIKPGSILVLISDFYSLDNESLRHLTRLREHNDILAYHICDQLELTPPKPQIYAISDGQKEILLDTNSTKIAKAYANYFQQKSLQLNADFNRLRIQYMQVMTDRDLAQLVRLTFPWRKNAR